MVHRTGYELNVKPDPRPYGWQDANGIGEESGWMVEGGEEAYLAAMSTWEAKNG